MCVCAGGGGGGGGGIERLCFDKLLSTIFLAASWWQCSNCSFKNHVEMPFCENCSRIKDGPKLNMR